MSEPISDDRLAEMRDTYKTAPNLSSALLELQERRKAEGERKKEWGIRSKIDGTHRGPMQSCTPEDEARSWAREFPEAYVPVWRFAAGEWRDLNR